MSAYDTSSTNPRLVADAKLRFFGPSIEEDEFNFSNEEESPFIEKEATASYYIPAMIRNHLRAQIASQAWVPDFIFETSTGTTVVEIKNWVHASLAKESNWTEAKSQPDLFDASFLLYTPVKFTGNTIADRVARELESLKDGWAGAGSIAPSADIVSEIESVLDRFPSNALMPSIEVEEDDGSVAIRWIAADGASSFALVFRGRGKVVGISATANPPRSVSWVADVSDEIRLARVFEEASTYKIITGS